MIAAVRRALALIPANRRRRLVLLVMVQLFLGTLDLIAVSLVGLLGSLSVSGVQSKRPSGFVATALEKLHLAELTIQMQVAVIAVVVVVLLLGRTYASILLTRKALHFLSLRSAEASGLIMRRLLAQPLTFVQSRGTQELLYAVMAGTSSTVLGVLGSVVVMAADVALLITLSILLFAVSPVVALALGVLMLGIVLLLHRASTAKAGELGIRHAEVEVRSRNLMAESIATYRDAIVRGTRGHYALLFADERIRGAYVSAELAFLPNVSKYVLETAVVLAALAVGGIQFGIGDAQSAVGVIAVFLAAGTRLSPAIIRVQQGVFQLRTHIGQSRKAIDLIDAMPGDADITVSPANFTSSHGDFMPSVRVHDVSYRYPGALADAVSGWSLELTPGQMVALVGPSGAGKSTAADLLLGVLQPAAGEVVVCDRDPRSVAERWPGAIGFVPQDVWIADGSIRENVALGFDVDEIADDIIWHALDLARLADHVRSLPRMLDAQVGERGTQLSGGQRQRLGIARALVTQPRLLILDEATSALDASTEHEVTEAIRQLQGQLSLVVIAHRLATVRHADIVQYFDEARVRAQGSFEDVRREVPMFEQQAKLLGL